VPSDRAGNGSACRSGQVDERIIAHRGDCLKCHVAGPLDGPLIIMFEKERADEPDDGVIVGEDTDDLGPTLDLAVRSLDGFVECNLAQGASGKVM
jgi:hypothetical protein